MISRLREILLSISQDSLSRNIKILKQGLMSGHANLVLEAHKNIHSLGQDAIPAIQNELNSIKIETAERPEITQLMTGFLILLQDLDENLAQTYILNARQLKLPPVISNSLNIVERYQKQNYSVSEYKDIEIYEEQHISKKFNATKNVIKWLSKLPSEDIKGISRIYIIDSKDALDYRGKHLSILSVITLAWETSFSRYAPIYWITKFLTENTLYHEVGHHALNHNEPGQVPEQEKEADEYAYKLMRKNHPVFFITVKYTIGLVFKALKRIFRIFIKQ